MLHIASWNLLVPVDADSLGEITFWRDNVRVLNNRGMGIELDNSCEIEAFSDASDVGYGGYLYLCAGALYEGTEVFGAWEMMARNHPALRTEKQRLYVGCSTATFKFYRVKR